MTLITRSSWGARAPKSAPQRVSIGARTATCVHHDGPKPVIVTTFAQACARIRADQNYHMDGHGWADIGYNYLVISSTNPVVDGLVFEGRGRDVVGAHCLNHNTEWVGVQVAVGGGQTPTPAALASVRMLHDSFVASAGHSLRMVGHKDGFNTACPDPKLYAWVHAGMPVAAPVVRPGVTPPVVVSRGVTRKPIVTPPTCVARSVSTVKAIQGAVHVTVDGKWGNDTSQGATAVIQKVFRPTVRFLQARVGAVQDGVWGPRSEAARILAVKAIQRAIGVASDGDWGVKSQAAWMVAWRANYGKY